MVAIELTVMGMVLSAMPIGDYDKRLVILTKERGKITVFAKGARKPNSAFLACSQSFSFGEFLLYEGRSSYNMVSVNITNYFEDLRKDLEATCYGLYFCELADYFTHENDDGTQMLKLLYQSMRALIQASIERQLLRYIYVLKMLVLNGEAPQVFQCVRCGNEEENHYFNSEAGGLVCKNCSKSTTSNIRVNDSTIYTMQYINTSTIEKLYTFTVSKEVMVELRQCVESYSRSYIDRKMKSLELIEKLFK